MLSVNGTEYYYRRENWKSISLREIKNPSKLENLKSTNIKQESSADCGQ